MAQRWKPLLLTDLLFKVVAFVLLTPLAAGLLHLCLWAAGSGPLADADILLFFVKPLGGAVLVAFGAVSFGIVALEQAALLVILMSPDPHEASMGTAVAWAIARGRHVMALTGWLVVITAVVVAPFLLVAGLIAWATLGDYDINFYLAEWPAGFQVALACGAALAVGLAGVLAWLFSGWLLALPLTLFEQRSAREALAESRRRMAGSRRVVVALILAWAVASVAGGTLATSLVVLIARQVVPLAVGTLPRLVLAIGGTLLAWAGVGLLVNLLSTTSFATLLAETYRRHAPATWIDMSLLPGAATGADAAQRRQGQRRVVALVSVGSALLVGVAAVAAHQVRFDDDVVVMGHRGAGGLAPENTLAAVQQAIDNGADWVEIDVQETADGEVVVVHDSDFMKVAGVDLKVWDATLAEVEAIDVGLRFDPAFAGERVPTLAQVLTQCRDTVGVNIELKDYGHGQRLEERVAEIVEAAGMQEQVILMSLKPTVVKAMKALRPAWTVGLLMSVAVGDASTLEADFLAVNGRFVTRAFVARAHRVGKQVYAWTTNDAVSMSTMTGRGVDGLITDYPDLATRVLEQRAALSPVERVLLELAEVLGVKTSLGEP